MARQNAPGRSEEESAGVGGGAVKAKVKATPLPKLKILACSATFLTESICNSVLLPFVGLFVAHLQGISVEKAGYFSGILVGLFMLGQVISSKLWGWVSDVYGRKIPLTLGLFAGAIAMLFFGMAPNIYVCCLLRFMHGVFNGNVLIAKIIVSDVTDSTNAALGFSTIGLLWCVGSVIGPAIGGFLYDPLDNPALQWMHVKEGSFLAHNPAFLASLFVFLYTMGSFLLCVIVLPETNVNRTKSLRTVPVIGWVLNTVRPKAVAIVSVDDPTAEIAAPAAPAPAAPKPPAMTYTKALKDPVILTITILYMCVSAADMSFNEIMPLWAIASVNVGGLGMFSDSVGMLMLLFAIPTFASNLFFARIYKAINNCRRMWRISASLYIASIVLVPFASNLSRGAAFWYILLMGSIKNCVGSACFNLVHLQTARAAPPGTVGSVYGISQSFSYSVRTIVPFIAAPLFAWSISGNHAFPFNHYFVYFICVIPLFYSIYVTLRQRLERTEEELAAWGLDKDGNPKKGGGAEGPNNSSSGEEEDEDEDSVQRSVAEDYRSLANSFAMSSSTVDNLYAQLPEQPEGYAHPHHHHHGHHLHRVTDLLTVARGLQQEDERLKGVQAEEMLGETLRKEGVA